MEDKIKALRTKERRRRIKTRKTNKVKNRRRPRKSLTRRIWTGMAQSAPVSSAKRWQSKEGTRRSCRTLGATSKAGGKFAATVRDKNLAVGGFGRNRDVHPVYRDVRAY